MQASLFNIHHFRFELHMLRLTHVVLWNLLCSYHPCTYYFYFKYCLADIIAVQLFANEAGHPLGLMSKLFDNFYHDEVLVLQWINFYSEFYSWNYFFLHHLGACPPVLGYRSLIICNFSFALVRLYLKVLTQSGKIMSKIPHQEEIG